MIDKLRALLSEKLDIDPEEITDTASFRDDLYINSLDLFEIVTDLEEEYNFEIPAEDFRRLTNLKSAAQYLAEMGITE